MRRQVLSLLLAACATGCTLEPIYHRPAPSIMQQWPAGDAYGTAHGASDAAASDIGWRDFFGDEHLLALIGMALQHNPDLRVAALNIEAARAQYRIQRADLFPSIAATAVEEAERYPAAVAAVAETTGATGTGAAAGGAGATTAPVAGGSSTVRYFQVGVGFTSYELDLFGRVRSLNHQALETYYGYIETRRSTQISIVAEVASAYLTLQADQELLSITQSTLKSQQDSYGLTKMSFEGGVATALDLRQAETAVDTARANIALYTRQVAQDQNALTVLVGAPIAADLLAPRRLDDEPVVADLPEGMPSDLLVRRPDIASAERTLRAANANIGAARAAFLPRVTLTGNYGTASTELSGLFTHGSTAWTFSPQISLPIFAGGANVASLDLAKVQKNVDIVKYEQAIQTAFREVADALAGRGTLDEQLAATKALVDASQESYDLSDMLFRNGVDDYLSVLVSQRSLYSAQQSLVQVKLSRLQNLITLYKALGGGWYEQSIPQRTGNGDGKPASARITR